MNPLWSNIFKKGSEEDSLAHFLGNVPVFADLGKRDLALLEKLVHCRHYRANETVFEEGDPGSGMYVIRSGQISIYLRHRESHSEEELTRLGPGDFFGETTLTAPSNRTAAARTLEPTELVGLFRADLLETAEKNPAVASKILFGLTRVVSERLQAAGYEIRRLHKLNQQIASHPETAG